MNQVREVLRYHHYSYKTEQTYTAWILKYIRFHGSKTHPKHMGKNEVERFLSYLGEKRHVAPATQRQALNALVFLYKKVLDQDSAIKLNCYRQVGTPLYYFLSRKRLTSFSQPISGMEPTTSSATNPPSAARGTASSITSWRRSDSLFMKDVVSSPIIRFLRS